MVVALFIARLAGQMMLASPDAGTEDVPAGKLRVHIDTEFIGGSWAHRTFQVGVGRPPFADTSARADWHGSDYSTSNSLVGLGIGYLIHPALLVGARFGMNYNNSVGEALPPSELFLPNRRERGFVFVGGFTPYLEALLHPRDRLKVFFLFRGGFVGGTARARELPTWEVIGKDIMAPTVGLGTGLHIFPIPSFSVDLGVMFDYHWIHTRDRYQNQDGVARDQKQWRLADHGPSIAGTFGLSMWF
jgi:hypothetical protein